jgi:hypothetical protein
MNLGRLEKITDLREIWKTEAQDFTPWLAKEVNLSLLGETINLELELEAVEKDVGPFRADILCRDTADNSLVLVENQVERTDHTHLGQLLTYAAGLNTVTIVWIAKRFTDEHRATLDWLNEITGDKINFFGLEIELWKIGGSAIAPHFNIVSKPNDWTKGKSANSASLVSKDLTPTQQLKLDYWKSFRSYISEHSTILNPNRASADHWMSFGIGTSKAHMSALLNTQQDLISVGLNIDKFEERLAIFHLLEKEREIIERELGSKLDWEEKPDKKSSYIFMRNQNMNPNNRDSWQGQHEWMLKGLENFREVFGARIKSMDVGDWEPEEIDADET